MFRTDPPDQNPPYRRLTLLDLMGLVIASGMALAGWVYSRRVFQQRVDLPPERVEDWLHLVACLALGLVWWVVVGGLRRLRVERRGPGYLTAVGLLVGSGFGAITQGIYLTAANGLGRSPVWERLVASYCGSAIFLGSPAVTAGLVGVWAALLALDGWTPAGGTLDRVGLMLGVGFVLLFVANQLVMWSSAI